MKNIPAPKYVLSVLDVLEERGAKAYLVGGCVRDSLLGLDRILPSGGDRADALLVIEYRGDASGRIPSNNSPPANSASTTSPLSRGRY